VINSRNDLSSAPTQLFRDTKFSFLSSYSIFLGPKQLYRIRKNQPQEGPLMAQGKFYQLETHIYFHSTLYFQFSTRNNSVRNSRYHLDNTLRLLLINRRQGIGHYTIALEAFSLLTRPLSRKNSRRQFVEMLRSLSWTWILF
jgi:hypothetical protein